MLLENRVTTWTVLATKATITHPPPLGHLQTRKAQVCVCWAPSPSLSTSEEPQKSWYSHPFLLSTIHQNAKVICSQQWQQFATAQRTSWWSSSSCSAAMGVWAGLASAQHREQKTSLNSSEVKTIFSPINDWLDTHHLLSCRWFTRTSHLLLQRKAHHSYLTEDNPD